MAHGVRLLKVDLRGATGQYLIKDVQYDHLDAMPIHMDLTRVDLDERVKVRVGIELKGVAKGISEGGVMDQLMADIEIEHLLEAPEDTVWADPNQIEQVFVNIVMNSADAMTDTENSDNQKPKALTIKTANKNDSLEVTFADTGPGIREEDLIHVFDPFYTTKEPGKGTGLGLAVCHRIIEALHGTIRAESTQGQGTTIIIDIPLYRMKNGDEKMNIERSMGIHD